MPSYGAGYPVPFPDTEADAACFAPYGGDLTTGDTVGLQVHINPDPQYYVVYSPQNSDHWTPSSPGNGDQGYQHAGLIYIQSIREYSPVTTLILTRNNDVSQLLTIRAAERKC